jgi:hypothetical protein
MGDCANIDNVEDAVGAINKRLSEYQPRVNHRFAKVHGIPANFWKSVHRPSWTAPPGFAVE